MLSYASTSGLAVADNAAYPFYASMLMMMGGMVCGMAGSTTGGIKSDRLLILLKSIRAHLHRALHPTSVTEVKLYGRNIYMQDMYPHILYIAVFVFLWLLSAVLTMASGVDTRNGMMATLSSLCNVGPSVGALGTFGNFDAQPVFAKIIYTLDMFMGRVEIYPVMAIAFILFDRRRVR